jgi:hypothetical protein
MYKIRRQKPVRGGRLAVPSCLLKSIDQAVTRTADRHRVSKSFVIANILATYYNIEEQETINKPAKSGKVAPIK